MNRSMLLLICLLLASVATPAAVAEAPEPDGSFWPVGLRLPDELIAKWAAVDKKAKRSLDKPGSHIDVWVPEGAKRIRAIFVIANNTDSVKIGEHKAVRDVAARQHMAIMHFKSFSGKVIEWADPPTLATESFQTVMDLAAEKTGIDDLRHAPWITLGKSSRGRFPFRIAWKFPDRVIATISYHGETPTWPMADWSKAGDESILHCSVNGLSEWDGTWYRHVRPMLLNYNTNSDWLAHQAVILGVDHGYYPDYYIYPTFQHPMPQRMPGVPKLARCSRVWDYLARFIDSAISLRVGDAYPDGKAIKLKQIDRSSGLLIHPRAIEEILGLKWFAFRKGDNGLYQTIKWPDEVTPVYDKEQGVIGFENLVKDASDVPADQRGGYMWIADRKLLSAWLDLHNTYKVKQRILGQDESADGK